MNDMVRPYIGEIRLFGGYYAPKGWMFCAGQRLSINDYLLLYAVLGTRYGGDVAHGTFNLPDLQGRVPIHMGRGPDGATYHPGEALGVERVTLTMPQMAQHTHVMNGSSNTATTGNPSGKVIAQSPNVAYMIASEPCEDMHPAAISSVGGGHSHDNCQPFTCINYIIALYGKPPA